MYIYIYIGSPAQPSLCMVSWPEIQKWNSKASKTSQVWIPICVRHRKSSLRDGRHHWVFQSIYPMFVDSIGCMSESLGSSTGRSKLALGEAQKHEAPASQNQTDATATQNGTHFFSCNIIWQTHVKWVFHRRIFSPKWQESIRKLKEEREEAEIYRLHTDEEKRVSSKSCNVAAMIPPTFEAGPSWWKSLEGWFSSGLGEGFAWPEDHQKLFSNVLGRQNGQDLWQMHYSNWICWDPVNDHSEGPWLWPEDFMSCL